MRRWWCFLKMFSCGVLAAAVAATVAAVGTSFVVALVFWLFRYWCPVVRQLPVCANKERSMMYRKNHAKLIYRDNGKATVPEILKEKVYLKT
jgi:hypothetical protein